ncbi:MAG: uncharacterized protein QOG25_3674, partial [Acetobacteraceae bacterium]|nr:uncharacterized protein [Acetobacteraceae bacterium]
MYRLASFCVAICLMTSMPAAYASLSPAGGPALPRSSKSYVAYEQWNELLHKALDGDAAAATEIGKMYTSRSEAPHDVPEAMRWLSRGVDLGSNEARRELGLLLLRGEGAQRDPENAATLLKQAANAGDAEAEAALGVMYASGEGVAQDWVLAVDWSQRAADQDNPWAQ